MANEEPWTVLIAFSGALSAVFLGIRALKEVSARLSARAPSLPLSKRIYRIRVPSQPVVCPNCLQPFDATWSATYNCQTPRINGRQVITCPRCLYTFEA